MDQETLGCTPTPRPEAAEACGCMPRTPSAVDAVVPADHPIEPAPTSEEDPVPAAARRSLKLVVTLTPAEAGQYRAALALGADGCDPMLRSLTVSALSEALDHVPNLLDDAEAHWSRHPRNPTTGPAPRRSASAQTRAVSTATHAQVSEPSQEDPPDSRADGESPPSRPATDPVAMPTRPSGGQLTLFG
jgi:hypothetical protein